MRVLFVTHTVVMAGANSSMLILIKELKEKYGIEPVVLMPKIHSSYAKRNLYNSCQELNIECYSHRFYWFKNQRNWKRYLELISNLLCYPRILWKMRGKRFDLIHSNGSVISIGALLSIVKHAPHIWHLREFGDLDFGLHSLLGVSYEKWVYSRGDAYIAISDIIRQHFSSKILPEKIQVVYNGIASSNHVAKHNNKTMQICMVGMLYEGKNQMEALKAIDILVNTYNTTNFHLYFIGLEVHPYVDELSSFVEAHNLEHYVTFMGERSDVGQQLCNMDMGLMLSRNEAFGRVTIEYMMHGLAVIASHSGANQEIIIDGESGFIYQLGDVDTLAQKIKSLIDNSDKLLQFASKGRNRALELFTSERNTKAVNKIYRSLLM